jgi:LCP family protein required for cell wall assembly
VDPNTPPPCVPPDDWGIYVVEEGSTLESVAQRYGTTVETLMRVNCLNTYTIFPQQYLYVPGAAYPSTLAFSTSETPTEMPTPTPGLSPAPAPTEQYLAGTSDATANTPSPLPSLTATTALQQDATLSPASTTTPLQDTPATPTPSVEMPVASVSPTESPRRPSSQHIIGDEWPLSTATVPSLSALATAEPTSTPNTAFQVNIPNRYIHIVLLGSDKLMRSRAWRTDTMIILSIDVETSIVRLLSIPRDLWVYIPGHGYNRINTAELWGELDEKGSGPERVKQTIHHNLGIPIHFFARVDFEGFIKIVDMLDGLDVDVECPLPDIDLKTGMYHMDGQQALRYVRSRKGTSDFDRGRRQRKVLMALWQKGMTMDLIPKLPRLWVSMADAFETDLPLEHAMNLAYVGLQLQPEYILSSAINRNHVKGWRTPQGASVLLPVEDKLATFLEEFYAPKGRDQLNIPGEDLIEVTNGTDREQADELAAVTLQWAGFNAVASGPAKNPLLDDQATGQQAVAKQPLSESRIYVLRGSPVTGEAIAFELRLPLSAVRDLTKATQSPDTSGIADVQVILGKDYDPCQR